MHVKKEAITCTGYDIKKTTAKIKQIMCNTKT